jgi:hypothetical protein
VVEHCYRESNQMTKITIKYSISRTVALNEGRAEFGEATYQPTDTELAFLSLDDRKYLDTLDLSRSTFALPTGAPPTWPVIVEARQASRRARHTRNQDTRMPHGA